MKKDFVIVGGAGPQAGLCLMQKIISLCQKRYGCVCDGDFPYISYINFPFDDMCDVKNQMSVHRQLREIYEKECAPYQCRHWTIACHTLHIFLDQEMRQDYRLLHLMDGVRNKLTAKPVIACTSTSRTHAIHQQFFEGIYPSEDEQKEIDAMIREIMAGSINQGQAERLERMALKAKGPLLLGCTELSLLVQHYPLKVCTVDPFDIVAQTFCTLYFGGIYERRCVSAQR